MSLIEFLAAGVLGVVMARRGAARVSVLWAGFALGWAAFVLKVLFWVAFGVFMASAYVEKGATAWSGLRRMLQNIRFDPAEALIFVVFIVLYVLALMCVTWLAYWAYGRMAQKENAE